MFGQHTHTHTHNRHSYRGAACSEMSRSRSLAWALLLTSMRFAASEVLLPPSVTLNVCVIRKTALPIGATCCVGLVLYAQENGEIHFFFSDMHILFSS